MNEKERQDGYQWHRTGFFADYNAVVGNYQVQSCLEHSHGKSLLDVACGDGMLTELFTKRFERVVGVDASGAHLAQARRRLPNVEFHESLIEDLTLDERFDSVFMLDVLEHVADPVRALASAASFLKDDGVLIVHVPNANAINRRIAVRMGTLASCEELSPFDIDVAGHRRYYTREMLAEDVRRAGLQVTTTGGVFYKSLSSAQMDWFLKNGLWEEGGFGWGRVGGEKKDWKAEFCRACYEIGKEQPDDCNIVFVVASR
jgi:2-polyprenyl-3-methyl-5-hydroxy-6-metoxy-1,4-benzoquinol methylase